MSVLSPMAATGQCQAARRQPRRRDADRAVSAQSQSSGRRGDDRGAGGNLRPGPLAAMCWRLQDTSSLRVDEKGQGLSFHPVIAWMPARGRSLA